MIDLIKESELYPIKRMFPLLKKEDAMEIRKHANEMSDFWCVRLSHE
jgi:hypothetical protein